MKAIYLKRAGIALMTVMAMASCSDVVQNLICELPGCFI